MVLKKVCNHQGCTTIIEYGQRYCDKHAEQHVKTKRQYDRYRGTAAERGYDSRWQKESKRFLQENPLCVQCLANGKIAPSTVTDHIIPHKGDKELFWDRNNWQALCKRCHDIKTAKVDGGFGNGRNRII